MAIIDKESPDYKVGFMTGYNKGKNDTIANRKNFPAEYPRAYWIVKKGGDWYCSCCDTKYEQKHVSFCCKCGCKMSMEAEHEDNEIC